MVTLKLMPHDWRSWVAWETVIPKRSSTPGVNASWQKHEFCVAFISLIGSQQVWGGLVEFVKSRHGDSGFEHSGAIFPFANPITVLLNTNTDTNVINHAFILFFFLLPMIVSFFLLLVSPFSSTILNTSKSMIASLDSPFSLP